MCDICLTLVPSSIVLKKVQSLIYECCTGDSSIRKNTWVLPCGHEQLRRAISYRRDRRG